MKRGIVYCCDRLAGELVEAGGEYVFRYAPEYLAQPFWPAISATLPKRAGEYRRISFRFSTGCWPKVRKRSGSATSCASTRTMPFRGSWPRVPTGRSAGCMWWRQRPRREGRRRENTSFQGGGFDWGAMEYAERTR